MELSAFLVVILALISALSRGVTIVIDRYQIGIQKNSVLQVNLFNNLFSMFLIIALAFYFPFWKLIFDWRVLIYAALAQFVALGFSALYRNMTVFESVISAKIADFFIPIAVFLATGAFSLKTYILAVISTIIVMFWLRKGTDFKKYLFGILLIVPLLVAQAFGNPLLVSNFHQDFYTIIAFTLATLTLRFIISLVMFFLYRGAWQKKRWIFTRKNTFLYLLRAFLTIITHFTFVLVTADKMAALGWIFLNMTSLYGILVSRVTLKEKTSRQGIVLVVGLTALMIAGSFL
ncbi:hypothetical protein AB996_1577 [Lactococcus cremoris]|uniref:EamA domain-containing protein n=1 Tax=Lactococcus lactis subsp. cremoris TaxID=1359 RepID=A0A166JCU5_LACLC|nr:hypothetical protein [Lactococcus cremoris]KZK06012.1 hypothetical protein AB996_1577 [Lactococcus cremoris]